MRTRTNPVIFFALSLIVLAGCGSPESEEPPPRTYGASGQVHWKKAPLPDGVIEFLPEKSVGGKYSRTGTIVTDGQYKIADGVGLVPGRYRVRIQVDEKGDIPDSDLAKPNAKPRIPRKYNAETTLVVEVTPDGPNVFDFQLD